MKGTLWGGTMAPEVAEYTAGSDRALDNRLLAYDVLGTLGHLVALEAAGVVTAREAARLRGALRRALRDARRGTFTIGADDEDAHSALERRLVRELGELGERVHAGRSRNDQVAVDLRLFARDRLLAVGDALLDAVAALLAFARRYRAVVFPGYTHLRRAMPSTIGLWAAGFADALLDDLGPLGAALNLVDRSPLGSAAGYGVPLALDRGRVARALGFAGVQRTVTAVQGTRGKLEAVVLSALWNVGFDLAKLAWDVTLFSGAEYGYLVLQPELATGSSIMPHKRNPDVFELTRARAGVIEGCLHEAMAIAGRLPSGYHRDFQLTKGPLLRGLDTALEMMRMTAWAVPRLAVDRARCAEAVAGDVLATDEVFRRVRAGAPFRKAYRQVAAEVKSGVAQPRLSAAEILAARRESGGAGNLALGGLAATAARWRRVLRRRRAGFDRALHALAGGGGKR
jgi:argininosuccinate lyase